MKKKDILLSVILVTLWGVNFTVIKLGLDGVPSMMLVSLRYLLTSFPAIFFVKKPKTEVKYIVFYGLTVGVGQFACMFYAMELGIPAGIASVVLQIQAFISPLMAMIFLKEKLNSRQITGFIISAAGLIMIAMASTGDSINRVPVSAFMFILAAPVFWASSNIIAKIASDKAALKGERLNMISMVVWSGLVPPVPMMVLALIMDKPETILDALFNINAVSIFAILYLAYAATLIGYGIWSILLASYPMSKISPIPLLVPIVALLSARIVLSEQLSPLQWAGFIVILTGLIIANTKVLNIFAKNNN